MTTLLSNRKKTDCKLVGGYLPPQVYTYMTLYALAKGTTKTNIIKELLEEWVKANSKRAKEGKLLEEIVERLFQQWKSIRTRRDMTFEQYKAKVGLELQNKGLGNKVELIMKGLG